MRRMIAIACALAAAVGLLAGCGKKNKKDTLPENTPVPTATVMATPKISMKYNSLEDADQDEIRQAAAELEAVAWECVDIYVAADKGSARNVVLSRDTVREMVDHIGSLGFAVVDFDGLLDMRSPESIEYFGSLIDTGTDIAATYYMVYNDGQISAYRLGRTNGLWYLIAMSCGWDKNCVPTILTRGRYVIGDVKYTEKGWLIYSRDTASFDVNQRSNTSAYVFVRVRPCDPVKRGLCDKYVKPIGYFENNLFTTNWDTSNYVPIDFNSLYSALFGMYNGTEALSASNMAKYYESVAGTRLVLVPTENFERIVRSYFNIDPAVLKAISDYSSARGGYYFYGYADGIYNVTPRFPEPEVVDYHYNSDGSITMTVDAVFKWYGTDKAFSHELTVIDTSDGFRYVSNRITVDENNLLPECKISSLLDIELEKIKK